MKFTKTAIAVAAIVGSVAVSAQTANVTLYGYINTSIESNRGSQGANNVGKTPTGSTVNRMTANSSRFGLRGREELGGGTYAFFQLENSFGSDDGSLGGVSSANNQGNFDARAANAISYASPNFGGLRFRTMYSLIAESSSSPNAKLWDTAVIYANGPLTLAATNAWRVYGRYNFGVARIDGSYDVTSYKLATGTLKMKYFDAAVQVPFGASTASLQYSQRDNGAAWAYAPPIGYTAPTVAQLINNWSVGGGKHIALVYDYAFSKRTQVYAYYSSMKNETGGKVNTPAIGVIHKF